MAHRILDSLTQARSCHLKLAQPLSSLAGQAFCNQVVPDLQKLELATCVHKRPATPGSLLRRDSGPSSLGRHSSRSTAPEGADGRRRRAGIPPGGSLQCNQCMIGAPKLQVWLVC